MSRYEPFQREGLRLGELNQRGHDISVSQCLPLGAPTDPYEHAELAELIAQISAARRHGRPVIVMMGAHPIKLGLSRFLVDLLQRRVITHLGLNGAGLIHDFELAVFGGTSEDAARWIRTGQFGMWRETSRLNDLAVEAAARDEGLGEAVGRTLCNERAPHAELSVAAAGWRAGVPVTVHVGVGCDIVHAHPNCDGAAWGKASYTDFLIFARSVQDLEGGVFVNLGTAVIGPEVYLKALAMARNVAVESGKPAQHFTTAVFDLVALPTDWRDGTPPKSDAMYYYRPWKTILSRTVAGGGKSYFFCGDHRQTIPTLWQRLIEAWQGVGERIE